MELKEIVRSLSAVPAPSGFEESAAGCAAELLRPFVDELRRDAMGNLIAIRRCGIPGARTLMLDAHMDEIGFIVTGYDKGFLRFSSLGGIDPRMLPAREVMVMAPEPLYGVIDTLPVHILDREEMDKSIDAKKLCIDVGLSEEEARKRVPLGTPAVFAAACRELGGRQLCGKALDDRACLAVMIRTMERLQGRQLGADIVCLVAVQEELGLRGAVTGAFSVAPDWAVTLDVTHAGTPDAKKSETMELGAGAAIAVGPNMSRTMTDLMREAARRRGIPHQIEVIAGQSGTNAWAIQVSRQGVATALLSIPVKYMHTPVETMALGDAESAVDILEAFITDLGGGGDNA